MIEDCTLCGIPVFERSLCQGGIAYYRDRGVDVTVHKGAKIVRKILEWDCTIHAPLLRYPQERKIQEEKSFLHRFRDNLIGKGLWI